MEIKGISENISMDFSKAHKISENVKVSNPNKSENIEKEVKSAVIKINKFLEGESTHLQYEKHEVFNEMIIKVVDNNSNEVLREIPSRKILDMVAKMCEMAGVLVDKKA
ncbi:flagellar protein FlaG [Clostridium sp.]|jgi:flagellar protein FlaG|uniref:flagellar protein FlaG n=1 Tax=Clostridium sp. TaxID=1506 RepID=UPI003EE85B29